MPQLENNDIYQSLFTIDMLAKWLTESELLTEKQRGYATNIHGLANKLIYELLRVPSQPEEEYQFWSLSDNGIVTYWGKATGINFQEACKKKFSNHPSYDYYSDENITESSMDGWVLYPSRMDVEDLLR